MKKKLIVIILAAMVVSNSIHLKTFAVTNENIKNINIVEKEDTLKSGVIEEKNKEVKDEEKTGKVPVEAWCGIPQLISEVEDKIGKSINDVTYEDVREIKVLNLMGVDKELPIILAEFDTLRILNLTSSRGVTKLPEWFYELSELRELNFNGTQIQSLSPNINKLTKLNVLDISTTNISSIPKEIAELKELKILDIGGWDLSKNPEIPNVIYDIENLEELRLTEIGLTKLDDGIKKLKKLNTINLSFNDFNEFPNQLYEMPNLSNIYISYNRIEKIDDRIENIKNLSFLTMSYNKLTELPSTIKNIKGEYPLKIYASNNYIYKKPNLEEKQIIELCNNFIECSYHNLTNQSEIYGYKQLALKIDEFNITIGEELNKNQLTSLIGIRVYQKYEDEEYNAIINEVNEKFEYELLDESNNIINLTDTKKLVVGEYVFKVKIKGSDISNSNATTETPFKLVVKEDDQSNGNNGNTEQQGDSNTNNSSSDKGELPYTGGADSRETVAYGSLMSLIGVILLRKKN